MNGRIIGASGEREAVDLYLSTNELLLLLHLQVDFYIFLRAECDLESWKIHIIQVVIVAIRGWYGREGRGLGAGRGIEALVLFPSFCADPSRLRRSGGGSFVVVVLALGYASKLAAPAQLFRGGFAVTRLCDAAGVAA